jgi:hypothetical protein
MEASAVGVARLFRTSQKKNIKKPPLCQRNNGGFLFFLKIPPKSVGTLFLI